MSLLRKFSQALTQRRTATDSAISQPEMKSPSGYAAPQVPATREPRYNRAVIDEFVRSHSLLPGDDFFAQVYADEIYRLYADYVSRLPPYRQILLIDGDRPNGSKRFINFGESLALRRYEDITGIYHYWQDSLDVRIQNDNPAPDDGRIPPTLRSTESIWCTIGHETSHQQDQQLGAMWGKYAWSEDNPTWTSAVRREIKDGNTGQALLAHFPGMKVRLHEDRYQRPHEAKAEFEALLDTVFAKTGGNWKKTSEIMAPAYPHMWPVFHDGYLLKAMETAALLNPHIDMDARPAGFEEVYGAPQTTNPIRERKKGQIYPSMEELCQQGIDTQTRTWLWRLEKLKHQAMRLDRWDEKRKECHEVLMLNLETPPVAFGARQKGEVAEILKIAKKVPAQAVSYYAALYIGRGYDQATSDLAHALMTVLKSMPTLMSDHDVRDAGTKFLGGTADPFHQYEDLLDDIYKAHRRLALIRRLKPAIDRLGGFLKWQKSSTSGQAAQPAPLVQDAVNAANVFAAEARQNLETLKRVMQGDVPNILPRHNLQQSLNQLRTDVGRQAGLASQELISESVKFAEQLAHYAPSPVSPPRSRLVADATCHPMVF